MTEETGRTGPARDWEAIRADYEARVGTLDELAARHAVTRSAISWRAKRHCWRGRNTSAGSSGPALAARLLRLIERQLFHLEQETGRMNEKDIVVMGRLAATLERLMALETKVAGKAPPTKRSKEMLDLRDKLMARIERLSRS